MKHTRWMIPVILALLIATTAFSALAYFSAEKTTTGTIHSGTLTLFLSKDGVNYGDNVGTPWDLSNAKPGDTIAGKLYMYNSGSIDAKQVTLEWGNILNNPANRALADHMFATSITDSGHQDEQLSLYIGACDFNHDLKVSLTEIAQLSTHYGYPYDAATDVPPFLPAGGTAWHYMAFQFDPAAGNEFQNNTMTYDLKVTAWQEIVYPAP